MNSDNKILVDGQEFKLLFGRKDILKKVYEFANQIIRDYDHDSDLPVLLFVLTGGAYLGVDLSRALDQLGFQHIVDMVRLKRYDDDEKGGVVRIISPPSFLLANRDVIVVEDLIDEGKTMNFLHQYLKNLDQPPRTIEYCTLILKDSHGPLDFNVKYLAYSMGPNWVIGNGMDSKQFGRGLLNVYVKVE
ncbi:MAG: hypothetical protein K9M44_03760 [Candidatus Pacebacteria bacterium]|nr:hypothetical protein [Candidatus Paceibacterota bacterium]